MNILEQADKLTAHDRNEDYGHPVHDFGRTAEMWSTLLNHKITARQVGLCMIALKLSRQFNKPKKDNLIDIAGYARTIEMIDEYERDNPDFTNRVRVEDLGSLGQPYSDLPTTKI